MRHRRLNHSVRKGGLSSSSADIAAKWASKEVRAGRSGGGGGGVWPSPPFLRRPQCVR